MNWKRIARDLAVLGLLAGTFYFSAIVIGKIGNDDVPTEDSFSNERIRADRFEEKQDWISAAHDYRKMVEKDRFNGYASFKLAICYVRLRLEFQEKLNALSGTESENAYRDELQQQFDEYEDLALAELTNANQFLRHQRNTLLQLAAIHTDRHEFLTAMDFLTKFVDRGYFLLNGLANIEQFGVGGREMQNSNDGNEDEVRLHRFPEFWDLVIEEYELRTGHGILRFGYHNRQ